MGLPAKRLFSWGWSGGEFGLEVEVEFAEEVVLEGGRTDGRVLADVACLFEMHNTEIVSSPKSRRKRE